MKILIWGTGKISDNVILGIDEDNVIGYIETKKRHEKYNGKKVYSSTEIIGEYDAIVIANRYGKEIYDHCININIDLKKLCFLKPIPQKIDVQNNLKIAKSIFTPEWYDNVASEFGVIEKDWIAEDAMLYTKMNTFPTMQICEEYNMYIYHDKVGDAGSIRNYFWQDLWGARKVYKKKPQKHYDIGSRIDGFVAHLLTFMDDVHLIDIRPLNRDVDGLNFICADATTLNNIPDNSIESLSALCSLEHFGLGRYGDPIDPEACYKCFDAISRKVKKGGNIYISVPIGKEHIEFNAHRVFFASSIISSFSDFTLKEFSVTSNGYIEYNVEIHKYDTDDSYGGTRVGLFHFEKN